MFSQADKYVNRWLEASYLYLDLRQVKAFLLLANTHENCDRMTQHNNFMAYKVETRVIHMLKKKPLNEKKNEIKQWKSVECCYCM